jgi:hypothetical protein
MTSVGNKLPGIFKLNLQHFLHFKISNCKKKSKSKKMIQILTPDFLILNTPKIKTPITGKNIIYFSVNPKTCENKRH